jgi:tetratricopeptide (TPR) repeat protein
MSKAPLAVAGMAVLIALGAFGFVLGRSQERPLEDTSTEDAVSRMENDLAEMRKGLAASQNTVRDLDREAGRLREKLMGAEARLEQLEAAGPAAAVNSEDGRPTATPEELAAAKRKRLAEMQSLQDKVFSGKATSEEQARFWKLARTSGVVDEMMSTLEQSVKDDPYNNATRMQLSQAYVAKLLSIPGGPEQGVWAMKAETQWKTILEREPEHWDAQYSLAFSWSQYPDFLNKTPDAIKGFEKLRETQEGQTPNAKHGQTYLQLSILYRKQGNTKGARDILRAGADRHPDDKGIAKALESMGEE